MLEDKSRDDSLVIHDLQGEDGVAVLVGGVVKLDEVLAHADEAEVFFPAVLQQFFIF